MPVVRGYNAGGRATQSIDFPPRQFLLIIMARYLPSAQAKRGDENLDHARNLRDQWKDVIPGDDMESLQNRITMCVSFTMDRVPCSFTYAKGNRHERWAGL